MRLAAQAKLGFYPVAPEVVRLLAGRLTPPAGPCAILDPCAGTGVAIGLFAEALGLPRESVHAIELSDNRGEACRLQLAGSRVLAPCDFLMSHASPGSFAFAWVNPPFCPDEEGGGRRLEYAFLGKVTPMLATDGILALYLPERQITSGITRFLLEWYADLAGLYPPERPYDEILIVGRKRRAAVPDVSERATRQYLDSTDLSWKLPGSKAPRLFQKTGPTPAELERMVATSPLERFFDPPPPGHQGRCPLPLAKGHLALLLIAGQLNGVLAPEGEPPHVVRGIARKEQYQASCTTEETEKGSTTKTVLSERIIPGVRVLYADGNLVTLE